MHSRIAQLAFAALVSLPLISLSTRSACFAGQRDSDASRFRAGAASVDITPQPGVRLDGTISKPGPVKGVHDPLHARAVVLDDGTTRIALVICDACMIGRDVVDHAKALAERSTALQADHILIAATHTHAAVRAIHVGTGKLDDAYHEFLGRQIAAAISQAEKNLAPAEIAFGSFDRPSYLACRRVLCEPGSVGPNPFGEHGEQVASVAMAKRKPLRPAGPVDPQFSIVSIRHADGQPLAVLGNYSVHYCGGYRSGLVSADYFGCYARALEERLDAGTAHPPFVGLMSNGTSGNTGAIKSDGKRYPPFEWMKLAGRSLADQTIKTLDRLAHRSDVRLGAATTTLRLRVRKPDSDRIAWAKAIVSNQGESRKYPHQWTRVFAQETLHLAEYPPETKLVLQAFRIGDTAIVGIPCEVFAETGLAIKRASPFETTFIIELSNGYGGYLPPPEQHRLGGYETWPARSSFLEVEAEPKIRRAVGELLKQLERWGEE